MTELDTAFNVELKESEIRALRFSLMTRRKVLNERIDSKAFVDGRDYSLSDTKAEIDEIQNLIDYLYSVLFAGQ